ncbi:hypothetical protein WMF31_25375 [Sorangium sp. So ce1036]|uniref:hypothetical protein n=1 Tax=Sorangium sp. So ce1036 TaxID=3133328 RepID=UPI003F05F236
MITKQLKRLLMLPSPNALRLRPPPSTQGATALPGLEDEPAPRPPGEPAPSRPPEVPSYLRAAPAASGLASPAASGLAAPAASGRASPAASGLAAPAASGLAAPAASGLASPATSRLAAPASAGGPPRPVDDPASLVPPGMRGFTDLRGTQPTSDAAARAPVLPFGPPAPPLAGPVADSALVPEGMRGFTSLTGTHPISGAPAAPALPFASAARAAPDAPSSAAPDAPSSAAPAPALSLEQYASLCADLAASPGDAEALFARYGLGRPEARLAVDGFWRDRLARDPAAHRRWRELYWQHRSRSSPDGKSPHDPR